MNATSRFDYDIHYTGSKGNSVSIYYKNIGFLLDIGKPYKYIEPFLYNKQFILISHKHGDHIKWNTYKKIRENFPHIKILSNATVNAELDKRKLQALDVVFSDDFQFKIGDIKITCIANYHGVGEEFTETQGWVFETPETNLLYATDLSTTLEYNVYLKNNNIESLDTILLEANYDERVIEFYESTKAHTGYDVFSNGSYRHLALSEFQWFVNEFSNEHSIVEELHQSETYRTFDGLIKKSKGKIIQKDVDKWLDVESWDRF